MSAVQALRPQATPAYDPFAAAAEARAQLETAQRAAVEVFLGELIAAQESAGKLLALEGAIPAGIMEYVKTYAQAAESARMGVESLRARL